MRFVFIDRIERIVSGRSARGTKVVSFEEAFLERVSEPQGFLPRLLLMEAAAQLVSWLVLYSTGFQKIPLVARVERLSIFEPVICGTTLTIEAGLISLSEEGALAEAGIFVGERLIARGERCLCTLSDLERLADVSLVREDFARLTEGAEIL
ncbi:MAG: hypothetical protein HGA78_00215 [Nitrospirales bacterium]|nr:hypothetical protein [Nitrospirales bacterium]